MNRNHQYYLYVKIFVNKIKIYGINLQSKWRRCTYKVIVSPAVLLCDITNYYSGLAGGKLFAVNGPGLLSSKQVAAFEVDYTSGELQGAFSPNNQVRLISVCH